MRTVDLFSGCGGMSLGFQNAGYEIIAAFDNWNEAVEVYRSNFKHPVYVRDLSNIEDISDIKMLKPDVIIGGPPCQDFSSAGLRQETSEKADLTIRYAQIISEVQPRFFVMENVERVQKSNAFKFSRGILKDAGYGITQIILDASFCGVPQRRKRFFMVGEQSGNDGFLDYFLKKNLSKESMTLKEYFGDSLDVKHYYRHPRSYTRRGVFSVDEPSPTIRGVNRPIPEGYPGHLGDSTTNLCEVRPLTTFERACIQTFPPSFVFLGSKTQLEQMIGNAVPVKLAEYVANALRDYVDFRTCDDRDDELVNQFICLEQLSL